MSHLLSCWDIVEEGISRRFELKKDLDALKKIMRNNNWQNADVIFETAFIWENKVIVVTDIHTTIIHATENMFLMNGYEQREVLGQSPKIFQGVKTEAIEKAKIRKAIARQKPFSSVITNYRKDGSIYKCHIEASPIFNKKGNLVNFIALENIV